MQRRFEKSAPNGPTSSSSADSLIKTVNPALIGTKISKNFHRVRRPNAFEVSSSSSKSSKSIASISPTKSISPKKQRHQQPAAQNQANTKKGYLALMRMRMDLKSVVVERKLTNQTNYSLRAVRRQLVAASEDVDDVIAAARGSTAADKAKGAAQHRRRDQHQQQQDEEEEEEDQDQYQDDYHDNNNNNSNEYADYGDGEEDDCYDDAQNSSSARPTKKGGLATRAQARLMMVTTTSRKVRYGWYDKGESDQFRVVRECDHDFKFTDPDERICFNERKAWAGNFVMCIGQTNLCKWL